MIGIVASVWLYYNFTSWLTLMGYAIPPVGGVVITDYFMHQNRYQDNDTTNMKTAKWYAVLAVVAGAVIGLKVPVGIGSVNSIIAACVIYFIGDKDVYKRQEKLLLRKSYRISRVTSNSYTRQWKVKQLRSVSLIRHFMSSFRQKKRTSRNWLMLRVNL